MEGDHRPDARDRRRGHLARGPPPLRQIHPHEPADLRAGRRRHGGLFCLFASIATIELAAKTRELLEPKAGASHAAITRYAILIVGFFTTLVLTLELFGVPIGQLVLGGALTSVFVGIAAQQALGNVFAGLVLVFARPFHVGDAIRLGPARSAARSTAS